MLAKNKAKQERLIDRYGNIILLCASVIFFLLTMVVWNGEEVSVKQHLDSKYTIGHIQRILTPQDDAGYAFAEITNYANGEHEIRLDIASNGGYRIKCNFSFSGDFSSIINSQEYQEVYKYDIPAGALITKSIRIIPHSDYQIISSCSGLKNGTSLLVKEIPRNFTY